MSLSSAYTIAVNKIWLHMDSKGETLLYDVSSYVFQHFNCFQILHLCNVAKDILKQGYPRICAQQLSFAG